MLYTCMGIKIYIHHILKKKLYIADFESPK